MTTIPSIPVYGGPHWPKGQVKTMCVVRDPALKRRLRRTLKATGSSVDFFDSVSDAVASNIHPNLLFLDQESRRASSVPHLLQVIGDEGKIVVIGDSLNDNDFVSLMLNQPLNHLVSNAPDADESELVVTSVKLLKGDIFGLDKYLSWGIDIQERTVQDYDEKRVALEEISTFAQHLGVRRKILSRIVNVADELLMNAIYDAPEVAAKNPNAVPRSEVMKANLSYASDGRYFAVAVVDQYGELQKSMILDNLMRARSEKGRPRQAEESTGAGLGIYFVLSSVTRYIANIEPGKKTEIICLFDLRQTGREAAGYASSLHIFTNE